MQIEADIETTDLFDPKKYTFNIFLIWQQLIKVFAFFSFYFLNITNSFRNYDEQCQ